jgi:hypothetical protein
MDKESIHDPLKLLAKRDDGAAPVAKAFPDAKRLVVRANESSASTYYPLDRIHAGDVDVIAHVHDFDNSAKQPLAPVKLVLTVETEASGGSPPSVLDTFELDFDQPLKPWHNKEKTFYNRGAPYVSLGWPKGGDYQYYFVLTNGHEGSVSQDNAWHATPGSYTLHVRAWDVANNVLDFQEPVVVR